MATYTFAGVTYEQDDTPDQIGLLGGGVNLGGAGFSSGFPTQITQSVGFQAVGSGPGGFVGDVDFDPFLSVGQQAYDQHGLTQPDGSGATYAAALNLPSGNAGATVRHGIEMSWSDGRALVDGTGDEIVIYESATGTASTNDEAFMVRLELHDGSFTEWRYEKASGSQQYFGQSDSANATLFDLADFGVTTQRVVGIQLANLTSADRVSGSDGQGFVLFDGSGFTPQNRSGSTFASGSLDPDPLYVGVLSTADMVSPTNSAPIAQDDSFTAGENTALTGQNALTNTVPNGADSDPDNDPIAVTAVAGLAINVGMAVDGASGGKFTILSDGSLSFDPDGDFETLSVGQSATTTITYTISDGFLSDTATVTVTVNGANDAPVADDDALSPINEDSGTRIIAFATLLANDDDIDALDTLTITGVSGAVGGSVSIAGSNVLFAPGANYHGPAGFTYTVSDGNGGTDTASVSFHVLPQPEADIFTAGNDTVDLNTYDLSLYDTDQATRALAGNDVVQLSNTQNLGVAFRGNGGADTVTGSNGGDEIYGDAGADKLYGGNGHDVLWGGAGDDTMAGGNGYDIFAWSGGGAAQTDVITDFTRNVDVIDLSAVLDLGEADASNLQLQVVSSSLMRVRVDTDGNGSLDLQINVSTNNANGWNVGAFGSPGAEIWLG